MNASRDILSCALLAMIVFATERPVRAVTVDLGPAVDAYVITEISGATSVADNVFLNNQNVSDQQLEQTVVEFDISSIPNGTTVNSASFSLVYNGGSSPGITLIGYTSSAAGSVEVADLSGGTTLQPGITHNDFGPEGTRGEFDVTSFLQDSVDAGAGFVGFRFDLPNLNTQIQFRSQEFSTADRPMLSVDYVPEPATLALLASASLWLIVCPGTRSRRQS